MKKPSREFAWHSFNWQRPIELEDIHSMLSHLSALTPRGFLAFEARARNGRIIYSIGTDPQYSGKIQELIQAHGSVEFSSLPRSSRKPVSIAKSLTVSKPILLLNTEVAASAIRSALAAMSATKTGEEAVVQVILGRGFSPSVVGPKMQDPHESWLDLALFGIRPASPDSVKSAKEKAGQFMFQTIIRVGVSGKQAEGRLDNILSAFRVLSGAGVNIREFPEDPKRLDNVHIPWQINLRLSVKEIAPFLLLPVGGGR